VSKWLSFSLLVLVLDQLTKWLAVTRLDYGEPVPVLSWFNLTLVYNRGAAFSFLSQAGGWQRWFFTVVGGGAVVIIVFWLRRLSSHERWTAAGLALILGGAVGNLVDRVRLGYVVDFIDWHYGGWHWPAFNIADSAITVGAVLLILDMLMRREREQGA